MASRRVSDCQYQQRREDVLRCGLAAWVPSAAGSGFTQRWVPCSTKNPLHRNTSSSIFILYCSTHPYTHFIPSSQSCCERKPAVSPIARMLRDVSREKGACHVTLLPQRAKTRRQVAHRHHETESATQLVCPRMLQRPPFFSRPQRGKR